MGKASMSDITAEYVDKFWELIDEILNALLFVLIGLELLIIQTNQKNCFRYYNSFYYACNKIYFGLYPSIAAMIKGKNQSKTILILTWAERRNFDCTCAIY
jgi:CPA1 family monovalent cation:H+ antiporter